MTVNSFYNFFLIGLTFRSVQTLRQKNFGKQGKSQKKRRDCGVLPVFNLRKAQLLFRNPTPTARRPRPKRIMVEGSATATGALSNTLPSAFLK